MKIARVAFALSWGLVVASLAACGDDDAAPSDAGTPDSGLDAASDDAGEDDGGPGDDGGQDAGPVDAGTTRSATITVIGRGVVTSDPAAIDCGGTEPTAPHTPCSADLETGATLTLHAAAADAWRFTGWSGDCSGTTDATLTLDADRVCTATFALATWTHVLDFGDSDTLDAVLEVPDALAWIVAGTSTRAGNDRIWLARVDTLGRLEWSRLVSFPSSANAGRRSLTPVTGGFAVVASLTADVLIARFDFDGNPQTGAIATSTFVYDTGALVLGEPVAAPAAGGGLLLAADAERGPLLARLDAATLPTYMRGSDAFYPPRPVAVFDQPGGGFVLAAEARGAMGATGTLEILSFAADESLVWGWRYGMTQRDFLRDAIRTSDGGYLLAGSIDLGAPNGLDLLLVRIDADGAIVWQKAYGEAQSQVARAVVERPGGAGFVVVGTTVTTGATGSIDAWVIGVTADGTLEWQRRYGGDGTDQARAVTTSRSGGFFVAGRTTSTRATGDGWLLRIADDGSITGCPAGLTATTGATATDTAITGLADDLVRRSRTPIPIAVSPSLGVPLPGTTTECTGS